VAVRAGPDNTEDGDGEQGSQGHVGADESHGEDGGHDMEAGRGGMGQRSEEAGDGAGEGREQRAARQSVQTRARAWMSWVLFMRRLRRSVACTGDAARPKRDRRL